MYLETLRQLFDRDLSKLYQEIELYSSEKNIWVTEKNIANSAGNLCLHLIGNLTAFIGAALAGTDYVRDRENEFSQKNVPRKKLLEDIADTKKVVDQGLRTLTTADLEGDFPLVIWDKPSPMTFVLIHLATHLNYHLGQVNYHRRLLDS